MSSTLLQLMQKFCLRRLLPKPAIVMASQDDQTLQLVELLNEVLEDLTTRYVGTALQKSTTWASLGTESQGVLTTLAPYGFKWMINETFWDRTARLPVFGPKTASEWETLKATPLTSPYLQYRIQGGELLVNGGALPVGHTLAFEYASDWSVYDGAAYKASFTADTDTNVYPDSVLLAGLNWKWRLEKGLDYAEAYRTYEAQLADFTGHDGTKSVISMEGDAAGYQPGIFVPTANWPLP